VGKSFTDREGQEWLVEVTVLNAEVLKDREHHAVDILDAKALAAAYDSPIHRFFMLWEFCKSQATELKISATEFDRRLGTEEAWTGSTRALQESLTDFFHRIGMHSLAGVIERTIAARDRLDEVAAKRLDGAEAKELIDLAAAKVDQQIDEEFAKVREQLKPGSKSTN
jgi:hypothetical protein